MTFYIVLWGIFLLLSAIGIFGGKRVSSRPMILIILILAIFVGFRVDVGDDWATYRTFFYTGIAEDKTSGKVEPVFTLIRWICYHLGFSHAIFLYVVSCISLFCIYRAALMMKVENMYLVFFVYLSLCFCNFQFNIVRNGAMASCMWLTFAYRGNRQMKKALLWAFLSAGFHIVGLVTIPFLYVVDKRFNKKWTLIILITAFVLFALKFSQRIIALFPFLALIDRFSGYVDSDRAEEYGISIGLLFNIGLFIVCYFFLFKKKYLQTSILRILLNSLLISITMGLVFNAFGTIVARIGQPLNMALAFLWPIVLSNIKYKPYRLVVFLMLVAYSFLYYQKSWSVERENGNTPMLPYQIDMSQIFDSH